MSYVGKKNLYRCKKCGWRFVTVDRDEGTTPFLTLCKNPVGCGALAQSAFYRIDQTDPATYEWYRPDQAEIRNISNPNVLQHVAMGGLLLRPIEAPK